MWTKVEKLAGRTRSTVPVAYRPVTNPKLTQIGLPLPMVTASSFDFYSDENGRVAIHFHEKGSRRVSSRQGRSHMRRIVVPAKYVDLFPIGTTPIKTTEESGMIVIDTAQFQLAAE